MHAEPARKNSTVELLHRRRFGTPGAAVGRRTGGGLRRGSDECSGVVHVVRTGSCHSGRRHGLAGIADGQGAGGYGCRNVADVAADQHTLARRNAERVRSCQIPMA